MNTNRPCAWHDTAIAKIDSIEYKIAQLEKDNEHLQTLLKTTMKVIPKYTTFYKTLEKAVKS